MFTEIQADQPMLEKARAFDTNRLIFDVSLGVFHRVGHLGHLQFTAVVEAVEHAWNALVTRQQAIVDRAREAVDVKRADAAAEDVAFKAAEFFRQQLGSYLGAVGANAVTAATGATNQAATTAVQPPQTAATKEDWREKLGQQVKTFRVEDANVQSAAGALLSQAAVGSGARKSKPAKQKKARRPLRQATRSDRRSSRKPRQGI